MVEISSRWHTAKGVQAIPSTDYVYINVEFRYIFIINSYISEVGRRRNRFGHLGDNGELFSDISSIERRCAQLCEVRMRPHHPEEYLCSALRDTQYYR